MSGIESLDQLKSIAKQVKTDMTSLEAGELGELVDCTARLSIILGDLIEALESAKTKVKVKCLTDTAYTITGERFLAKVSTIEVSRLDTVKVKKFLGVRLPDYQNSFTEYRLTFKAVG